MQSLDNVLRNFKTNQTGEIKVSDDVIKKMIKQQILVRDEKGNLDLNENRTVTVDRMRLHESLGEIMRMDDEENMTKSGILAYNEGELGVNKQAVQALIVLAKYYDKKVPEDLASKEADAGLTATQ